MHHDTAGDTLGWLNEFLCTGGRELDLLLLSFQIVFPKMTDALKFMHLS